MFFASRLICQEFQTFWLVQALLSVILFNILHQGGLLPAQLALNQSFRNHPPHTPTEVFIWRTLSSPRHLVVPTRGTLLE